MKNLFWDIFLNRMSISAISYLPIFTLNKLRCVKTFFWQSSVFMLKRVCYFDLWQTENFTTRFCFIYWDAMKMREFEMWSRKKKYLWISSSYSTNVRKINLLGDIITFVFSHKFLSFSSKVTICKSLKVDACVTRSLDGRLKLFKNLNLAQLQKE